MLPVELRDWAGGKGYDGSEAFQCLSCGETIDLVILSNRIRTAAQRVDGRKQHARHPV